MPNIANDSRRASAAKIVISQPREIDPAQPFGFVSNQGNEGCMSVESIQVSDATRRSDSPTQQTNASRNDMHERLLEVLCSTGADRDSVERETNLAAAIDSLQMLELVEVIE